MEKNRTKTRSKTTNFVVQGSILAIAGILVRLIGMVYRIPLINIIGQEGNGYYTSAFSVYSILLIISSYSLPVAVSKMVAARLAREQYRNSLRILKLALIYATVVGGLGAAVLWFGAETFALALKKPFCKYALETLAPTIWIMAYLGVLRGYFQGKGTMVPTAFSQILEQIINAVISVFAAYHLFAKGVIANAVHDETAYSYAYGAAGGTIGTGAGALAAFLFFLLLTLSQRKRMRRRAARDKSGKIESYGKLTTALTFTILPIVLSSTIYNISSVVDDYLFSDGMAKMGVATVTIVSLWGIFGQYHLLFNIPVAISNALSSSLIPSLSRAVAARDRKQVKARVALAIRFSMIIAIPSTVGMTILAGPVNNLLFAGTENTTLIKLTMAGSLAVLFFSLSTVTNAILQGINHMNIPLRNAFISLIIHVAALHVMLRTFNFGIYSVVFANIIFAFIMCILNALAIRRYLRYRQELKKTFILPTVASAFMGAAAYGVYRFTFTLIHKNSVSAILAIIAAVFVYGVLLIRLRCIEQEELKSMPMGGKIIRVSKKLHLL